MSCGEDDAVSDTSRFAVSTSLFQHTRLDREHLVEVAAHGFDGIELVAMPSHADVTDPAAVAQLAEWLDDTRLRLEAVHAPVAEALVDGTWQGPLSIASKDADARTRALAAAHAALALGATVPFPTMIVPVSVPAPVGHVDESIEAARESIVILADAAAARGVQLGLQVQAHAWSSPDALVELIEALQDDGTAPGIGLDIGQARLLGDPVDAIETASGHIVAARLSDGRGRRPEPLVPYDGAVDWDAVLLAFQKVGYCGPWTLVLPSSSDPQATLTRAAAARRRLDDSLGLSDAPFIP